MDSRRVPTYMQLKRLSLARCFEYCIDSYSQITHSTVASMDHVHCRGRAYTQWHHFLYLTRAKRKLYLRSQSGLGCQHIPFDFSRHYLLSEAMVFLAEVPLSSLAEPADYMRAADSRVVSLVIVSYSEIYFLWNAIISCRCAGTTGAPGLVDSDNVFVTD